MEQLAGFQAGVNLGGWLSQYRQYDHDHFKSFITADDIQKIAGWGLDHVRPDGCRRCASRAVARRFTRLELRRRGS